MKAPRKKAGKVGSRTVSELAPRETIILVVRTFLFIKSWKNVGGCFLCNFPRSLSV